MTVRLGLVGLGRIGSGVARRLVAAGHQVAGFDQEARRTKGLIRHGVEPADSLDELVARLEPPRLLWLALPAGSAVDSTMIRLLALLAAGDTIVDAGNSNPFDTLERAERLSRSGVRLVDVGTSGGTLGAEVGYCLMIGGDPEVIDELLPVFRVLAPEGGWERVGPVGAGHYVKMVHNAIEYALMQAYAEGFGLLRACDRFDLDLHRVANLWRHGSVVRSWLLDLVADILGRDRDLRAFDAAIQQTGEGRWAALEALRLQAPAPAITLAVLERLASTGESAFSRKLVSALRAEFGGHGAPEPPAE